MVSTLPSDTGVWGTACGSGVKQEWVEPGSACLEVSDLSRSPNAWTSGSQIQAPQCCWRKRKPAFVEYRLSARYLRRYLIESSNHPMRDRCRLFPSMYSKEVEIKELGQDHRAADWLSTLYLSSTLFLLHEECLKSGTRTAASVADVRNHSHL